MVLGMAQGDSAKALAVSGLSVLGRDRFGVFPLKGKLLNVREASHRHVRDNVEFTGCCCRALDMAVASAPALARLPLLLRCCCSDSCCDHYRHHLRFYLHPYPY